jgi:hypothetical protein
MVDVQEKEKRRPMIAATFHSSAERRSAAALRALRALRALAGGSGTKVKSSSGDAAVGGRPVDCKLRGTLSTGSRLARETPSGAALISASSSLSDWKCFWRLCHMRSRGRLRMPFVVVTPL